jgi:hypothetical protein
MHDSIVPTFVRKRRRAAEAVASHNHRKNVEDVLDFFDTNVHPCKVRGLAERLHWLW